MRTTVSAADRVEVSQAEPVVGREGFTGRGAAGVSTGLGDAGGGEDGVGSSVQISSVSQGSMPVAPPKSCVVSTQILMLLDSGADALLAKNERGMYWGRCDRRTQTR
jgi:hypothetical protein